MDSEQAGQGRVLLEKTASHQDTAQVDYLTFWLYFKMLE